MRRYEQFSVGQLLVDSINGIPTAVGMGESFYLVPAQSANYRYWDWLVSSGVNPSNMFTSLASAENAMQANRGDTLFVYPGDHAVTASITWDKSNTNIVGVGSKNQRYQPSTLTVGGIRIKCVTTGIDNILNITGDYVSLYNIGTFNSYDAAANVCDIKIAGRNFYAEGCSFRGGTGATQVGTAVSGVPIYINSAAAGGGNSAWFKDCVIGSSGNTDRTKGPGCVYFIGGAAAGFAVKFENCEFSSRISTANADQSCLILLEANYAVDRELLFKNCNFYNFVENLASQLDYAIQDECATTHSITIDQTCTATGIDAWTNATTYLKCSAPAPNVAGGIGVNS